MYFLAACLGFWKDQFGLHPMLMLSIIAICKMSGISLHLPEMGLFVRVKSYEKVTMERISLFNSFGGQYIAKNIKKLLSVSASASRFQDKDLTIK